MDELNLTDKRIYDKIKDIVCFFLNEDYQLALAKYLIGILRISDKEYGYICSIAKDRNF